MRYRTPRYLIDYLLSVEHSRIKALKIWQGATWYKITCRALADWAGMSLKTVQSWRDKSKGDIPDGALYIIRLYEVEHPLPHWRRERRKMRAAEKNLNNSNEIVADSNEIVLDSSTEFPYTVRHRSGN